MFWTRRSILDSLLRYTNADLHVVMNSALAVRPQMRRKTSDSCGAGSAAFVAVVKPADLGNSYYVALVRNPNRSLSALFRMIRKFS